MSDTKNIKKPCNQLGIRSYKYYDDNGKIIFFVCFSKYQWLFNKSNELSMAHKHQIFFKTRHV